MFSNYNLLYLKGDQFDENCTLATLKSDQHFMKVTVSNLYMLMGRDLEPVEEVQAGNIFGMMKEKH